MESLLVSMDYKIPCWLGSPTQCWNEDREIPFFFLKQFTTN